MQSIKSDLQSIFHQYDDIQELFLQGDVSSFDINACDSHGKTLLHHACKYGLTEGVSILLANNAQVDVCDEKGYTPLHYACQNNHIHYDICKIVIQSDPYYLTLPSNLTQGGNGSRSTVTSQDECSRTILHYACIHGDFDIVDNLLKAGADPCAQDKLGNSPMHYACENGHLQCVRQLIATSCQNPNELLQIPNNDGVTPLSMKTHSGGTILHIACENLDVYVAAKLLEAGADSNSTDVFGFTPLMRAVIPSRFYTSYTNSTTVITAIIATLCNNNCDVNAKLIPCKSCSSELNIQYCEGSTALHIATDNDSITVLVINALIHNGAALHARDVHGRTPLHIASMRGHHRLMNLLAHSPESLHIEKNNDYTPLYFPCKHSHFEAFLNVRDNDGCTPLYYTCKNSNLECMQSFLSQCPDNIRDVMKIAYNDDTTPLSVRTGSGGTILHAACNKGDINLVKKLLEAGADPNVTDALGFTPLSLKTGSGGTILHAACDKGDINVVKKLLEAGADPNETDALGFTPLSLKTGSGGTILHAACDKGDINLVKKLLEAGADPNVTDGFGFTPLMRAVVNISKSGITTDSEVVSSIITALCYSKCSVNAAYVPSKPSDSNVHYCEGSTALHMVLDERPDNDMCVRALVDNGGALDARDVHGRTPLHIASMQGYHLLIKLLAPSPESFYFKDNNGCTPLYYACENSHLEFIRKFIVHIPEAIGDLMKVANNDGTTPLSVRTNSGGTLLHVACDKGDKNLVKMLLEAGADLNEPDEFGFTPLQRALMSTSKSSITSDVHCYEGSTAVDMAIDNNILTDNQLCALVLVDNGAALGVRDVHGRTPLHFATMWGYHRLIKPLAPSQEAFYFKDNDGCTPLYYACKNSHVEVIRKIIVQTPDAISDLMKVANNDGTTPLSVRTGSGGKILHVACDKGDINLVKMLLEVGADPNVTDEFGFTPLMRAVVSTSKSGITTDMVCSIINALCNIKCNVNATYVPSKPSDSNVRYYEGSTALHMAIDEWTDNQLCVQALVDNGAALDARDVHGRTSLHIASMWGHHRLIKLLAPTPEPFHFKDNDGCTPLYYACKNSHIECIRKIIVQAPDVIIDLMKIANNDGTTPLSVRTGSGGTILHVACDNGDTNVVKKLLEAGADPNITDKFGIAPLSVKTVSGGTILHAACYIGDINLVKKILEAGADPDSLDGSTFTPLMLAVQHVDDVRAADIVTILCEFKCNINIQTSHFLRFVTALHLACELGKEKCVQILVSEGANLLVRAQDGLTPLHLACKGGYHTFISSLITEETVKAYDYYKYWTPLHYACGYHNFECARMIVVGFSKLLLPIHAEFEVPFNSLRDEDGRTILHHACLRNDIQFVENLLNLGADPNVQDNDGATPIMSALQCHGSETDMNLLSLLLSLDWKPDIKDNSGRTALHHSANCNVIRIPLMLISAGCDVTAVDSFEKTFSDLISKKSLQLINKQLLRIDRRQIICVVGYPKCGKTTIIAAFQQAQQNRGINRFTSRLKFNTRVTLDNSRTSGIDTKVITSKSLGSFIFFDFAGQSEYYASHLAFLESALSAKGSTITFIMMVDLRCSEEDRKAQCKEWLFPIKSILKDRNMLNLILIGSHLDQVGSVSTSTSSLRDTLRELKRTLGTPQMQFIDCWGMDCRQLSSKGMTNLQNCLQSTSPAHDTSAEASQVPFGACLLFDRLKKSVNPPLAITPTKIIDKLKDGHPPFPLTVKYIDSFCQDLAVSGLVVYIPNRDNAGESWLILEMEEILSRIHGKLFAPDSAEFPMHHKNLANQFGLVHVEELTLAFKDSPLDPEMVQKLLTAMEFCHLVDSSLMTDGILDVFFSKYSHNSRENLLFFPSLVKANEESVVLSTESDIPGDDCHWVCWELSTVKPHFLHPRFQQAVFIRLACNHVQKHKADLGTVEDHSCTISKNAMSWSTIHGVDVCVQIMHKSTIKVLARNRPGVKVSSLMEMFSNIVSDVLTVRANHAPGVDAYSVFRVMEKGTPGEHTVPVSSIIDVVHAGGMFVNSRERPPKLVSLKDLFLDWEISKTLLEEMVSISKINHDPQATPEAVSEDTHSGPLMVDKHYYESELRFLFIYSWDLYYYYFSANRLGLFQFLCPIEIEVIDISL